MNDHLWRSKVQPGENSLNDATYSTLLCIVSVMAQDLTAEILNEMALAVRKLGGNPATVQYTDTHEVNRVLAFLGADIYLLNTVGSWGDTQSDEQTLSELRDWNAHGKDGLIGTSLVSKEWKQR